MPTHYGSKGGKMGKKKKKGNGGMAPMTKKEHEMFLKAEKDGIITKKQHNSLPPNLLKAIIKKKTGK
tara:strand:+ start:71 stop:271 length:201 start_codon:yes stop_codon:yes gene_type:complete